MTLFPQFHTLTVCFGAHWLGDTCTLHSTCYPIPTHCARDTASDTTTHGPPPSGHPSLSAVNLEGGEQHLQFSVREEKTFGFECYVQCVAGDVRQHRTSTNSQNPMQIVFISHCHFDSSLWKQKKKMQSMQLCGMTSIEEWCDPVSWIKGNSHHQHTWYTPHR